MRLGQRVPSLGYVEESSDGPIGAMKRNLSDHEKAIVPGDDGEIVGYLAEVVGLRGGRIDRIIR